MKGFQNISDKVLAASDSFINDTTYEQELKNQQASHATSAFDTFVQRTQGKDEQWNKQHFDNKNIKDNLIQGAGNLVGQSPAFVLSEGILGKIGLDVLTSDTLLKGAPAIAKVGSKLLYNAANGYLVGHFTDDDPYKSAAGFAIGGAILEPFQKYVGKLLGLGGQRLLSQMLGSAKKAIAEKAVESEAPSAVVALAGSQKQKINAATIRMLNDLADGNYVRASKNVQANAIKKLAKIAPELEDQLSVISPNTQVAVQHKDIMSQRKISPTFDKVMTNLEKVSGTPAAKSLEEYNAIRTASAKIIKDIVKVNKQVPGAASTNSYEFEDNLSKQIDNRLSKMGLGKDKYAWEDRGHKLLFALNILMTDNRVLGASKERNKLFDFTLKHLQQRYPEMTTPQLIEMSDNVWSKIENLHKVGLFKDEGGNRIFRQSEFRPGQSPFSHEVELLQDAAKKDQIESGINELQNDPSNKEEGVK